jgi:GNAT superfamily N-acetyltransferase
MSFLLMIAMSKLWNTKFLALYDNDTPYGFVYLAKNKKLVFIIFFAVDKSLRSHGYGSEILAEIKRMYPSKKIIVSIEPCSPESDDIQIRIRRKNFYLRNGFKETGWQMKLNGVEQEILVANGDFRKRQFIAFLHITVTERYGQKYGKYSFKLTVCMDERKNTSNIHV